MNYLRILYEPTMYDDIISFLKQKFRHALANVAVDQEVSDQLLRFSWTGLLDPNELAEELSELYPSLIIECPSQSGIESSSRYFNNTQLW